MKAMCPTSYHQNGFVATHALAHMMQDPMNKTAQQAKKVA